MRRLVSLALFVLVVGCNAPGPDPTATAKSTREAVAFLEKLEAAPAAERLPMLKQHPAERSVIQGNPALRMRMDRAVGGRR